MQISIVPHGDPGDDHVMSVRVGDTRRQGRLGKLRRCPFKFPRGESEDILAEPVTIELMRVVACSRVVLRPGSTDYRVSLVDKEGSAEPLTLDLRVEAAAERPLEPPSGGPPEPTRYQDTAASAKEYLEKHSLMPYIQALLQAVIRQRPDDPFCYMREQLDSCLAVEGKATPSELAAAAQVKVEGLVVEPAEEPPDSSSCSSGSSGSITDDDSEPPVPPEQPPPTPVGKGSAASAELQPPLPPGDPPMLPVAPSPAALSPEGDDEQANMTAAKRQVKAALVESCFSGRLEEVLKEMTGSMFTADEASMEAASAVAATTAAAAPATVEPSPAAVASVVPVVVAKPFMESPPAASLAAAPSTAEPYPEVTAAAPPAFAGNLQLKKRELYTVREDLRTLQEDNDSLRKNIGKVSQIMEDLKRENLVLAEKLLPQSRK